MSDRRIRSPEHLAWLASLAVLVGFVGHNAWVFYENQRELPEGDQVRVLDRDLEALALENRHVDVHGRWAHFYFFEKELAGKHILLPPAWADMEWLFERISRVDAEVSSTPLVINPRRVKKARRLSHRVGTTRKWYYGRFTIREGGSNRKYQYLQVVTARKYKRYVLAETTTGRDLFLLPERTFEKYRAAPGVLPGPNDGMSVTP